MSDDNELRTLDVRIATELFGWQAPLTPHPTRPLARYATDWSLIPKLVAKCVERGWGFGFHHDPAMAGQWSVCLTRANGKWRRCSGDTFPLALCRAIVAVLDADGSCPEGCGNIGVWLAIYERAQKAVDDNERLRKIVSKYPKTADDVPIEPDTVVYQQQTKDAGKTWEIVPRRVTSSYWPFPGWSRDRCFSTRKAAEAATPNVQGDGT